jgi:hypothetical protein
MKSFFALGLLVCATEAYKLSHQLQIKNEDDDLDSIMDKYDDNK